MLDHETRRRRRTTPPRADPTARRSQATPSHPVQAALGNAATVRLLTREGSQAREPSERLRTGERTSDRDRDRARETRREQERDRRDRRPEGGRDRSGLGGHLQSDWAGRAILGRYLAGEGDWDISNDAAWSAYMKHSALLRTQLQERVRALAVGLAAAHRTGVYRVDDQFHAELENGEGIVGYQYLHGSNRDVGDFTITGFAVLHPLHADTDPTGNSGTIVQMGVRYTWNDMIDPNPQYGTDTVKSVFAEIITLGQAEAYRISISWEEACTVVVPEGGSPVMTGYPAN